MREIRFRGKCVDDNEWAYGDYYSSDEMPMRGEIGHFIKCGLNEEYRVIPETIGQYIELHDKNKKWIYDGDILEREGYWSIRIEYKEGTFWIRDLDKVRYNNRILNTPIALFTTLNEYEVIGNIFENPELLEEGDELNEN